VGKNLEIFAVRAVSLNHIYTHRPKIFNNICSYFLLFGICLSFRGTNTNQWEVPKIAGSNTKANIFQKGSAGFKATADLNKEVHQRSVSVYVKIVDLISLRHQYKYMEHRENKG
jgi:hypothetical protein